MDHRKLTAIGLCAALSVSAVACGGNKEEAEKTATKVSVQVQNPEVGSLSTDTAYIGTVTPEEQVYVVPKTSGTVTETFFEVGDAVKEGDVLFKIDDEAAQLQVKNAKAAYESAQAGVTAQNGGARNLQDYSTERQIQTLKDSLSDSDDQIDEMEDSLGDLRDAGGQLESARNQAQAGIDALTEQKVSQEAELQNLNAELSALQAELAELQAEDPVDEAAVKAKEKEISEKQKDIKVKEGEISSTQVKIDEAQGQLSGLDTQIEGINASKTQLKSGIEQLENSQDTIRDNITTAEQSYAITQNEIYPESDAASAASLQQAAVGIDSAQMQLDFCTVTSPINGIVEAVNVEKNGMAAAGNAAYVISNKESMTITFHVAEKAKDTLQVGDHVTVERKGKTYDGTITEIGTMAGAQTKLFQVKASVSGGTDGLPNGVSVKVYATTDKEEDKLLVPYDSIYFSAGDAYVYCVEDGKLVKTSVTVGLMSDTQAVIEEGLTADSQVVSNWSSKLRNGAEAEIVTEDGGTAEEEEVPAEDGAGEEEVPEEDGATPEEQEDGSEDAPVEDEEAAEEPAQDQEAEAEEAE